MLTIKTSSGPKVISRKISELDFKPEQICRGKTLERILVYSILIPHRISITQKNMIGYLLGGSDLSKARGQYPKNRFSS